MKNVIWAFVLVVCLAGGSQAFYIWWLDYGGSWEPTSYASGTDWNVGSSSFFNDPAWGSFTARTQGHASGCQNIVAMDTPWAIAFFETHIDQSVTSYTSINNWPTRYSASAYAQVVASQPGNYPRWYSEGSGQGTGCEVQGYISVYSEAGDS